MKLSAHGCQYFTGDSSDFSDGEAFRAWVPGQGTLWVWRPHGKRLKAPLPALGRGRGLSRVGFLGAVEGGVKDYQDGSWIGYYSGDQAS